MLDMMSRMEIIGRLRAEGQELPQLTIFTMFNSNEYQLLNEKKHIPEITIRKFDYIEMIGIVFGMPTRNVFLFSLC